MSLRKWLSEVIPDPRSVNARRPWNVVVIVGTSVAIILAAAPAWIPPLHEYQKTLQGMGFLVGALTCLVIGTKVLRPIVSEVDQWVASSALASWSASSIIGSFYGEGLRITDYDLGDRLKSEAPYAIERYGRFVLLSLPIGLMCAMFVAGILGEGAGRTKKFSLAFSLVFLSIAVGVVAYVSSAISELGLAARAQQVDVERLAEASPTLKVGDVVKIGTMDVVVYPAATLAVCLLIVLSLRRVWKDREDGLTTFIGIGTGLWICGSVLKWHFLNRSVESIALGVGGTGIGIGIALVSMAVAMCWIGVGIVRVAESKRKR